MIQKLAIALTFAAAMALPASGVSASGNETVPAELAQKIRVKLTEQGYDVRKIKMEDGMYEAYVIKDGTREELYMNSDLEIVKQKSDD
jgi:hypothetical protein